MKQAHLPSSDSQRHFLRIKGCRSEIITLPSCLHDRSLPWLAQLSPRHKLELDNFALNRSNPPNQTASFLSGGGFRIDKEKNWFTVAPVFQSNPVNPIV